MSSKIERGKRVLPNGTVEYYEKIETTGESKRSLPPSSERALKHLQSQIDAATDLGEYGYADKLEKQKSKLDDWSDYDL